jgi:hypothetical protein
VNSLFNLAANMIIASSLRDKYTEGVSNKKLFIDAFGADDDKARIWYKTDLHWLRVGGVNNATRGLELLADL